MRQLSCVPKIEGVDLSSTTRSSESANPLARCDEQSESRNVHWFVLTPSGYSVFVESENKAHRLRRLYDEMGLGWCSLMCEETDNAHSIPF